VPLDRQSIEKKDFPVGRRGYDPEAVDAHLSALAEEIADFKQSSRRRADTLASTASDQVRAIVAAAESSAADIQRDAESDAKEIRDEANSEARATREQASDQAREYVGKVSDTTDAMHRQLDSIQSELDTLIDSLRESTGRLTTDLKGLESSLEEVRGVVAPRPGFEPELPEPEPEPIAAGEPAFGAAAEPAFAPDGGVDQPVAEPSPATSNEDGEGARLIALNMALNGTPREETARYLDENFSLADAGRLLDEVYASVEG
jgi:DivIVA domain-containing protein